jgi:hypothetical protein
MVITAFDINLSLPIETVRKPAAKIVSATTYGVGRQSLVSREKTIRAGYPPQRPGWLAHRTFDQQLPACIHAALIPSPAPDRVYRELILERKIVKEIQRRRLHMSSCAEHTLACLYAVLEPEVEIHVLGLNSDGPAKIQSAARDAVVGSTGKFPDIPHGPAESTTDIEIEAVKSLRGSRSDSESTKGKQEQYPLTQYQSPVSIGRALLDYSCFFDAANWH